ncbi:MAG TPA: OsmC family peroxiredoxin [Candidatus Cloacimonetes bacterium]|nr:OsmC family peroxiredoxin [Candidatus Cloacimonadota bacterium]
MKNITKANWLDGMVFDVELNGHHFLIDADDKVGGTDKGPRPKGLVLSGLAGCTGMDVVSILKKMKIENYKLEVSVDAELTDEHPKIYDKINIYFIFSGENLPISKLKRAVELSETRYCGVSEMLRKTSDIKTKILLNGEEI